MESKLVLEEKKALVWFEIEKYLDGFLKFPEFCQVNEKYQNLINFHKKIVSDYPQRQGKYVRPTLLMLTAEAMGVMTEKTIKTAAAMQTSEDWILMHDDIEDESQERRGQPTLHNIYSKELAINAGDALQTVMWQIIGDIDNKKIRDEFVAMITRTLLGQTIEIKWAQENKMNLSEEDVFLIMESKTAYYTIAGPMRLGAILAGADEKQLAAIYEFGKPLGYCFQIRDDLLDLTSDFGGLKKQKGNDIYEGKRTIMLADLLKKIEGNDLSKLKQILSKSRAEKNQEEVEWVISQMKKYDCIQYSQNMASQFAKEARKIFDLKLDFLKYEPAKTKLKSGIDFILERNH